MREAVIVSTARTPIGKAYRGAFNNTSAAELGGHVIRAAVERAGVDPAEIDDVVMGAALPIILGAQLLLQAMNSDVLNVPSRPIHPYLRTVAQMETEQAA